MNKIKKILVPTMIIVLIILTSFSGCIQEDLQLDAIEINEYQGEKLGSVYDFRENSIKGPQYISKENYTLGISGMVIPKINLTYNEILNDFKHYKKLVTLNCVEGWSVKILWEGILIKDLLKFTNITNNASIIIFHAYDGYTTSLPIDYLLDNNIIIAFKMNNVTIPPERGFPFQLVAESKWGYKWIKWITEIEISDNEFYEGYWESRGYSNNADLNNSFFD
jgi:DMSO/TMAO reductase YedYZ molybdopterin-dependent catalytic subunit